MNVYDIGRILIKDPNVREALGTFHGVFDVCFGDVYTLHSLVIMGIKPGGEYIREILLYWKGRSGEGTGKHLLKRLENAGYNRAARKKDSC